MNDKTTEELVEAWHRFFANIDDEEKRKPDLWAAKQVGRLLHDSFLVKEENEGVIDQPEKAWEIILLLVKGAPSRQGLLAVAAGPLRQLLDVYFDEFISRVRDEVARNNRLAYSLSQVYIHDDSDREQVYTLGQRAAIIHFSDDDTLKQLEENDRLIAGWFRLVRERPKQTDQPVYEALNQLHFELPHCDPNRCWLVIQRLLAESQSKEELEAAGSVIGQLLSTNYADFIEVIRQAAPTDKRLAYALGSVYLSADQKEEWSKFIELVDQHRVADPFMQ